MLRDFLEMGGYATYVWSSYAVVLVVLAGMLIASLNALRARDSELKALEERVGGRRQRRNQGRVEEMANDA
ncbi:MAG: heme exporter protein CcmD [Nisaea sp.]|uniref:heme exporter protein CcmD n=1 Tax=Nisaea sp. TaxID=2024842 RepID=UPI001B0597BC|nr:heme exporter protein CcmD [Nisaea sp.]MBO6559349.1 heme exporter protein CcmD [Nisaea sp.]